MFEQLYSYFQTLPPVYAPSDASIWQDDYISKQMLSAHLNPDFEGASRPHHFIEKSVAWIKRLLPPIQYTKLLDIGCGPGIYAEKFCKEGYQVTGIDFSKRSIQHATQSAQNQDLAISYIQQDYLKMVEQGAYDLATFIYCDYGALSAENRNIILQNAFRSLKDGGKLLLDVFSMQQYANFVESKTWEYCPGGGFWHAAPHFLLHQDVKYADTITLRQTLIITQEGIRCFYLWDTYFTKANLILEAEAAGFEVCGFYGDVSGSPDTPNSTVIAILLQKP